MPIHGKALKALPLVILALIVALTGLGSVLAQDSTPIIVGEPTPGQVSQLNIAPSFLYTAQGPEVITVVVESQSGEFAPALRVLSGDNQLLQDVPNPANAPQVEAILQLPEGGPYILQVQSANGQAGSFTITISEVEPIPEPLFLGDDLEVPFSNEDRVARYVFDSDEEDVLRLIVETEEPIDARVTLSNEDGDELASFSLLLTGGTINIPPGIGQFLLTITYEEHEEPEDETVRVALLPPPVPEAAPTPVATASPAPTRIPLVPLPTTGPCIVASFSGGTVNLRGGPSTTFNVVATLTGNNVAQVIGRLADGSWYQVSYNGINAWVAGFVIRQGGECANVPVVPAPGATPIPPGALPDVSVGGISVTPAGPDEDEDFAINVTVNNTGSAPANNVLVRLTFNAPGISISLPTSELNIGQIPPFSAVTVNFLGIRANNEGNVQANVTLDPNNAVPETNDGNNTGQLTFTVGSNLADLVVSELTVTTTPGSTIASVQFRIRNQGAADAEDFEVRLRFSNGIDRTFDFDDIDSGDTEGRSAQVDMGAFGNYSVTARADSGNDVNESNEGNNERSRSFTLAAAEEPPPPDDDDDGVPNASDQCPNTPDGATVNAVGCPDTDGDGVFDNVDACADTPEGTEVDDTGCPVVADDDEDGVPNDVDQCANTPADAPVNGVGCPDTDGDGVFDNVDACADTPEGTEVDDTGCPVVLDDDDDGVPNASDQCANTPADAPVNGVGCPDTDGDGVFDNVDACADTPEGTEVDGTGCPLLPVDSDGDQVPDLSDACPGTLEGTLVNSSGCPDSDQDGVADANDFCSGTTAGAPVDANGCADGQTATTDADGDGVVDGLDLCPGTVLNVGEFADINGCGPGQTAP